MDGRVVDIFATKGVEYLLVLGFLVALIAFWTFLTRSSEPRRRPARVGVGTGWFQVPEGFLFHRGHAWLRADPDGLMRVGVDDFAQKLVGQAEGIDLPATGSRVEQGAPAWSLRSQGRSVDMLSPISGEVVEVNQAALKRPSLLNAAPYGAGWLFRVRAPRWLCERNHLLSGRLARTWMEETTGTLRRIMDPGLGLALQDGGVPVDGIARSLAPDRWDTLASSLLLTGGSGEDHAGGESVAPSPPESENA